MSKFDRKLKNIIEGMAGSKHGGAGDGVGNAAIGMGGTNNQQPDGLEVEGDGPEPLNKDEFLELWAAADGAANTPEIDEKLRRLLETRPNLKNTLMSLGGNGNNQNTKTQTQTTFS